MENKFIIECRYEHWTQEGKVFCNWYAWQTTPMSENEANEYIKQYKKDFKFIDDKTKLKHEYRLKPLEEYESEMKALEEIIKKAVEANIEYLGSDAYKELQKKKRKSAKERKECQKKYLEEHGI